MTYATILIAVLICAVALLAVVVLMQRSIIAEQDRTIASYMTALKLERAMQPMRSGEGK